MADVFDESDVPLESETASSDSETDGDEGNDDYEDIRCNIKPLLNLGQTLTSLWPISLLEQTDDDDDELVSYDFIDGPSLSKSLDWPTGSLQDNIFVPRHRRAPSLPSQGKLEQIKLQLDEINLTPDEEYGFNPRRSRSVNNGRRSLSLYAPDDTAGTCLSSSKLVSIVLSSSSLQEEKSHARNEEEAKIEEDIAWLRAQPSNVQFNRKYKAREYFEGLTNIQSSRKKFGGNKVLRRKLSFDSNPRSKTFSEGTVQPNIPFEGKKRNVFELPTDRKLFDTDTTHYGSEPTLVLDEGEIGLAPPPVLSSKTVLEVLVSNPAEKEKKRRSGIPQFLTALKLPNKKTIKRLMRKKSERQPGSTTASGAMHPTIPHPFPAEQVHSKDEVHLLNGTNCPVMSQTPRSPSVNTFARPSKDPASGEERKRKRSSTSVGSRNSCSLHSLQKVEEGKETSEFDGSLNRKSCSTCSIAVAKFRQSPRSDRPLLERRMSDTALTWKEERSTSCSPGRRFILRFLSPVVCGLNNEKYMNFQSCESYTSLASCSSDVSVEADLLAQKLTDFEVHEIAEELALIDKELLIRITWQELATCGWMSINKYVTSPNVMNMVEFFNRVAMMVATSILMEETAHLRAKAITKMIKLASKCIQLKNYNSLRAVLGGLQCTPIYRLQASWKQVRARRKRLFGELSNLMSEEQNFFTYREELKSSLASSPCIPFLGDFLTQIAQTQAYVAMRRKRSLAKQRMERASTIVADDVVSNGSQREVRKKQLMNVDNEASVSPSRSKDSGSDGGVLTAVRECPNRLSENGEVKSQCAGEKFEEKRHGNIVGNAGSDEVDNGERKSANEQLDSLAREDSSNNRDDEASGCRESLSFGAENEEYIKLNRKERESIRRSINGITNAMFQTGTTYESSENDNEFLEVLNEYLENQTEGEISVFTDIDVKEQEATASTSSAIDCEPNRLGSLCADNGVGSASSYDLSPTTLSSDTATVFPNHKVDTEKKTHARNDSNDSGVVLQNGRSSRASEELNGSRDNLPTVLPDKTDSHRLEDARVGRDKKVVSEEDSVVVDGKSLKIIPILERKGPESEKLEERIRKGRPVEDESKHRKEHQFWEYQIAAMKYQLIQRPLLRKYLLNAWYNSEEENYGWSLQREPIVKKA